MFSLRYRPLGIYTVYVFFSLLALVIGPVGFVDMNTPLVIGFVLLVWFAFFVGFVQGARGGVLVSPQLSVGYQARKIIIYVVFVGSGLALWDSKSVATGVALNFESIGGNYVDSYDGYVRGQATIGVGYVLNILSLTIQGLMLIFYLAYRPYLPKNLSRFALAAIVIGVLYTTMVSGKQKYLGDLVIYSAYASLLFFSLRRQRMSSRFFSVMLALVAVAFIAFPIILSSRYAALGVDAFNIGDKMNPNMRWDNSSPIMQLLGDNIGFAVGTFFGYFVNGLYGLNLALQADFQWTYFVGNSYSLGRIVEIIGGDSFAILERSYPFGTESEGWGLDKWHTLFSWMASDVTFPGVVLCALIFGWFYAKVWRSSINGTNVYAAPLFLYLSLGLIFSLANNQLMHSLSSVLILVSLLFLYFAGRRAR